MPYLRSRGYVRYGLVFSVSDFGDELRKLGATSCSDQHSETPFFARTAGPEISADFHRVYGLPRQTEGPTTPTSGLPFIDKLSSSQLSLLPIQYQALSSASRSGGLFAPISAGAGKSLITFLLPFAFDAKTSVLLVPASLREKTFKDYTYYQQHFKLPHLVGAKDATTSTYRIHLLTYSGLSSPSQHGVLDALQPDAVIADECHNLKHVSSIRTKRLRAYSRNYYKKWSVSPKFGFLSGTITSSSIKNYAHLLKLALGDGAPVPFDYWQLEAWAGALDPGEGRTGPGCLSAFCEPGEDARDGYRRRLVSTHGVVASHKDEVGSTLILNRRSIHVPQAVTDALTKLETTWCTPGGEEITDALSYYRAAVQISTGFFYRWTWLPIVSKHNISAWLDARANWHREIRHFLRHSSRPGCDSPFLYQNYVRSGKIRSQHYRPWLEAKKLVTPPKTETVWIDDFIIRDTCARDSVDPTLIWTGSKATSSRLFTHFPYSTYQAGNDGILLENGTRTTVASIKSHGTGKNLQQFVRSTLIEAPSSGEAFEQLLARTHRQGQLADEVHYNMYLHTPILVRMWEKVQEEAEYIYRTTGVPQRVLYATRTF